MDPRSERAARLLHGPLLVAVMLIGIGSATLLTGAVAERFVGSSVRRAVDEAIEDDAALLAQVVELAEAVSRLQRSLERRQNS